MFKDREEAGDLLALRVKEILRFTQDDNFVVVALLRGGIILGKRIADYFKIPLYPMAVKKIGAPLNPELGIGAVAFDGTYYFDPDLLRTLDVSADYKKAALENKRKEAKLLQERIQKKTKAISYKGENIIIVDDGVAIGNTAICASLYLRKQKVKNIILAIPVISRDGVNNIRKYFDRVIALKIVGNFSSVSEFYKYFPQISDEEVLNYLI